MNILIASLEELEKVTGTISKNGHPGSNRGRPD